MSNSYSIRIDIRKRATDERIDTADVVKELLVAQDLGVLQIEYARGMLDVNVRYMEFTNGSRPFDDPYDRRVRYCEVIVEQQVKRGPG